MPLTVGIIPARGGSKTIPRKNIKPLAGKPLIAWTIEAARSCPLMDRVIVSTDDADIAAVAKNFGSDVPFLRPAALAQDESSTISVVLHLLEWLEKHEGAKPDWIMVLQPTSPLRTADDITNAIDMVQDGTATSVVSVFEANPHPYLCGLIGEQGELKSVPALEMKDGRRQNFPHMYALNGAIYLNKRETLLEEKRLILPHTRAYIMPPERSIDIDTLWDFRMAEMIMKDRNDSHS